ncbi:carotenoid oxygenase family protein [Planomonospora sp. ID67723]|uniref:carotenoid oxygenase family protein n=1 Tax=Planomonospora sp. ID67723 TaxID=2738134 RepID=UPI0018C35EE1|nr:carotenoid oxygenase family protein [Planomonospora sp. ID67723]MBG0830150.1 carotenoid oxygenase family protein [Planomonospora sp. ID67723]
MPIPRSILTKGDLPDLELTVVSGRWPDDISGYFLISTSDQRSNPIHAFFGDGILVRLSLTPDAGGRFAWRPRVIDSPSVRLRRMRPELFQAGPVGTNSPFGAVNAANTAPLPWGDRLFATWDAGRPIEVDPATLAFVAEVGHRDDWAPVLDAPVLPSILSTAHPVIDPERGCLWSVTRDPLTGVLSVVRYDGSGRRVRRWPVEGALFPQATHTITQTRDWLVLADTAYKVDFDEVLGSGDRKVANNPDGPLVLVRKSRLEETPSGEAVQGEVFRIAPEVNHFYAAYDDSGGVRVLLEHTPGVDIGMYLREDDLDAFGRPVDPALRGMYCHGMSPAVTTVMEFDPVGGRITEVARLRDPERYWQAELSAIDWSFEGQLAPTRHHLLFQGFHPEAVSQRVLRNYGERIDRSLFPGEQTPAVLASLERDSLKPLSEWAWGLDDYPTSPAFVPRAPGANGRSRYAGAAPGGHEGYLVVIVHNDRRFRVELFDASDVSKGPIAVLAPPLGVVAPFMIHAAWMPTALPHDPSVERLRFADDLDDRLTQLDPDLQEVVREVAADR